MRFAKSRVDVICLQETKLKANEQHALTSLLQGYVIFFNNRSKNTKGEAFKGGTLVAVRIPVLEFYSVENLLIEPGHSQCLLFTPLDPSRAVVTVSNVRFQTGSGKTEKQVRAVDKLWKLLPPAHVRYLLGDLNFTSEADDSSGGVPDEPSNWGNFLREFAFNEVVQKSHTWFAANTSSSCSSRLDRVYLSLPETQWLLGSPQSWVTEDVLVDIRAQHAYLESIGQRSAEVGVNTHIPVFLKFFKVPDPHRRPLFHSNVFQDPGFLENFDKVYKVPSDSDLSRNPEKCLRQYKMALVKAYKVTATPKHKPERVLKFSVCLRAFRELSKPLPRFKVIKSLCEKHPFLRELVYWTGEGWVFTGLKAALSGALLEGIPDPANVPDEGPRDLGKNSFNRSVELLKNLKFILPSTKKRVSCLSGSLEVPPTSDPTLLGGLIQDYWGSIWAAPSPSEVHMRGALIDEYLMDYLPPLATSLPDLESKHMSMSILSSGDSAPGPDGIPFMAYRVTVEHATRVLLAYALHLRNRPTDLASFNGSTLLLLPKSSSLLVKDTRPLCISNADNRIVARSLVLLLTPTTDMVVDTSQQGFISGRLMSKHLFDLNQRFYDAWKNEEEYYVLFTDNAKAFDSIYHDFILKVLQKQGFPNWYIRTVESLLSEVSVSPTLAPSARVGIGRGVKQGCPLSPTLFVLVYDPLIRCLKKFDQLEPRAAADDLAVGATSLLDLFSCAIPGIDAFCKASGMGINRNKSEILSSCPLEDPPLHPSLMPSKPPSEQSHLVVPFSGTNVPATDPDDGLALSDLLGFTDSYHLSDGVEPDPSPLPEYEQEGSLACAQPIGMFSDPVVLDSDLLTDPSSVITPPGSPALTPGFQDHTERPGNKHGMSLRTRPEKLLPPDTPSQKAVSSRPITRKDPSPKDPSLGTLARVPDARPKRRKKPRLTQPKKASGREWNVHSIVDKRWNPYQHPSKRVDPERIAPFGFWEYKVRWEGFGPGEDTWEPLVNLSCSEDTVADFNASWLRPPTLRESLQAHYGSCPPDWEAINLVNKTKYLGIYFSNSKDTYSTLELNFRPALIKAKERLHSYRVVFRNVPLSTRILVVNVFVTSLFSYLIGFMLIPFPIYWEYRSLVSRAIVPFHGSAFKYEHLAMPPLLMGVKLCLADLWVQNAFRLLSRSGFRKLGSKLLESLPWALGSKDSSGTQGISYYSPLFDDSVNLTLMEFLGPSFLDWDGKTDLSKMKDTEIKRTLVKHGLHKVKDHGEAERSRYRDLVTKFGRYKTTPIRTLEHFGTISPSTPNAHLEHHLLLYTNALATDKRIRHFAPTASVHPLRCQWYPYPCYFCNVGVDSITHIYGECWVIRNLLESLSVPTGGLPSLIDKSFVNSVDYSVPLFIMDFPLPKKGEMNGAAFLLAFNLEIWHLRQSLRAGGSTDFNPKEFKEKLCHHRHLWGPDRPKVFSSSKYGNASKRTKAQRSKCFKDATTMVGSAGPEATLVFTDGSSIGNPGPSGAGAFVSLRSLGGVEDFFLSYPLGHNTNNVGELWAIGMALSFLLDQPTPPKKVALFTDSDTSLGLINRLVFSADLEHLVGAIRPLIAQLKAKGTLFFPRWIPGHAGIPGNELADRCADHGARTSRATTLKYPNPNERFTYNTCPKPRLSPPESE